MYLKLPETLLEMDGLILERDRLRRAIERTGLRSGPGDVGGMKMDGMPRGSAGRPEAKAAMDALQSMLERVDAIEAKLHFLADELRPMVESLPPGMERRMLAARYVDCLSMSEVARVLPYNRTALYTALKVAQVHLMQKQSFEI
ncbi:MAG: hypothetical protein PHY12_05720 [Eubacteriales bacterium]|nr:hypothetical protein [Eubacteriales bacterium]